MLRWLMLVVALMPRASLAGEQAVAGVDELAIAASRMAQFSPGDEFDTPPAVGLVDGQPFRLVIPLASSAKTEAADDPKIEELQTDWSYSGNRGELTLNSMPLSITRFDLLGASEVTDKYHWIQGFYFRSATQAAGSFVAENAYGARRTVSREVSVRFAVAEFGLDGSYKRDGLPRGENEYQVVLELQPAIARDTVRHLVFVITGRVRRLVDGQVVVCGSGFSGATLAKPFEEISTTCVVSVDIQQVSFENAATGAVLKTWAQP